MNERWLEDRDDDISKLFRDNEEQLEETPSFRTWDRVERKLERRRGQRRKVMYRYTSMVAASIGVLAMIYFIGFLDSFPTFDNLAHKTATESSESPNTSEKNTNSEEVSILEKQAEAKKINETSDFVDTEKEIFNNLNKEEEPIASNFPTLPEKDYSIDVRPNVAKTNDAKVQDDKSSDLVQYVDRLPSKKVKAPASDFTFPAEDVEEEELEDAVAAENENGADNRVLDTYSPIKKAEETALNSQGNPYKKEKVSRKDKEKSSTASRADKNKIKLSDEPKKIFSIKQFNWMNGNWRDISIGGSYESWEVGKNGLSGSGYVVINGDTSFVETMRIYQRGKDIFFEGPVDASQKTRKFKLESYEGNEATFNRKGKNFPNQVVITRHTNDSYSIIYQNKDAIKVNTTEQLYFKYRNRLNSQRAARNMMRY